MVGRLAHPFYLRRLQNVLELHLPGLPATLLGDKLVGYRLFLDFEFHLCMRLTKVVLKLLALIDLTILTSSCA